LRWSGPDPRVHSRGPRGARARSRLRRQRCAIVSSRLTSPSHRCDGRTAWPWPRALPSMRAPGRRRPRSCRGGLRPSRRVRDSRFELAAASYRPDAAPAPDSAASPVDINDGGHGDARRPFAPAGHGPYLCRIQDLVRGRGSAPLRALRPCLPSPTHAGGRPPCHLLAPCGPVCQVPCMPAVGFRLVNSLRPAALSTNSHARRWGNRLVTSSHPAALCTKSHACRRWASASSPPRPLRPRLPSPTHAGGATALS
jgi:hypothetical protein